MDLHKKIKRTFSVSKAFGDIGTIATGIGVGLIFIGYVLSFRVDHLENKLNKNNQKRRK
jgi:hypothetical protein